MKSSALGRQNSQASPWRDWVEIPDKRHGLGTSWWLDTDRFYHRAKLELKRMQQSKIASSLIPYTDPVGSKTRKAGDPMYE